MLKKFIKNQKGFTLVELMVVVVILAILVAIAVPIYNNASGNAAEKANAANIRTIKGAVTAYRAGTNNPAATPSVQDLVTSNYLDSIPAVPDSAGGSSAQYVISYSGNNNSKVEVTTGSAVSGN